MIARIQAQSNAYEDFPQPHIVGFPQREESEPEWDFRQRVASSVLHTETAIPRTLLKIPDGSEDTGPCEFAGNRCDGQTDFLGGLCGDRADRRKSSFCSQMPSRGFPNEAPQITGDRRTAQSDPIDFTGIQ